MLKHVTKAHFVIMFGHAREAVALVAGKDRSEVYASRMLALALVRLIETVGEAANRVSRRRQKQLSEIPWPQIIGMRNRLIHVYDAVDLDLVWQTTTEELPALILTLEKIVTPKNA